MIRDDFATGYALLSLLILVGPMLGGLLFEAPLLLYADRFRPRKAGAVALAGMAVFLIAAAFATNAWILAIAFMLWAPLGGIADGIAQGSLVDSDPENRETRMAQWTLAGIFGDLTAPALLAGLAFWTGNSTGTWRIALIFVGGLYFMWSIVFARSKIPDPSEDDEDEEKPRFRDALKNGALMLWLSATALCTLLDEILAAFGVLFVRDQLGGDIAAQSAVIAAATVGEAISVAALPKLFERISPFRVLIVACIGCAVSYAAWLMAREIYLSIILMAIVGLFIGPIYPIVKAQAYRALPERSALVNAVDVLFMPFEVAAPLLVGLAADQFGIVAALALLLVQPLGILTLAAFHPSSSRSSPPA